MSIFDVIKNYNQNSRRGTELSLKQLQDDAKYLLEQPYFEPFDYDLWLKTAYPEAYKYRAKMFAKLKKGLNDE